MKRQKGKEKPTDKKRNRVTTLTASWLGDRVMPWTGSIWVHQRCSCRGGEGKGGEARGRVKGEEIYPFRCVLDWWTGASIVHICYIHLVLDNRGKNSSSSSSCSIRQSSQQISSHVFFLLVVVIDHLVSGEHSRSSSGRRRRRRSTSTHQNFAHYTLVDPHLPSNDSF